MVQAQDPNPSVRFCRRLLAICNPSALAEAAEDPLKQLAFLCEDSMMEAPPVDV